jgi:hypothetical protein
LGEERADRWAPSVSDGGAVMGWQAGHAQRWAGVGAKLGRPRRKWPTMVFPF